ncbi:MAG TPA: type IX secretion system membrane protein PorP/SprF [Tenuifilaceae bacterium]|nr:type IX secretion system membrane protein PorP/SprF [Tenuifilaceae bacterium]
MKITLKHTTLFVFLIFTALRALPQQDPQFNQIMFNPMSINPGYAGSLNMIGTGIINKLQWVGFGDGAPVTTNVSINGPIAPFGFKSGIGLSILNDKLGFDNDLGISFSYAARFKFKLTNSSLGIGISGGFINNSINPTWNALNSGTDPSIPQKKESSINLDLGFGLYYNTDYMFFGASVTHLNETKMYKSVESGRYTRQYYLTGGYIVDFPGNSLQFEPSVVMTTDLSSSRFSFTSLIKYNKKIWGGVSYRIDEAITGIIGFELFNGIKFGYAYEFSLGQISKYNDGSHEFMLAYNFQLKKEKPPQQYKSIRFL